MFNLEGGLQWRFNPNWIISGSLGVRVSPRASTSMPAEMSPGQVKVGTTLTTGEVVPCVHGHIAFLWAFGCTGLDLGRLSAKRTNTLSGHSSAEGALWVAFAPRLGVEVPLPSSPHVPRFAALAFGDAVVPVLRRSVLVEEGPSMSSGKTFQVWDTPRVAAAFNLGLLARFDL